MPMAIKQSKTPTEGFKAILTSPSSTKYIQLAPSPCKIKTTETAKTEKTEHLTE